MDFSGSSVLFAAFVTISAAMAFYVLSRAKKERDDTAVLNRSVALSLHIPASLHPVIDPKICIGSLSCLKVCPEGDVLGVVDGKAALITGANCIGHSRCVSECPVDAIKLVFGTSERGVDLPEIDEFFESSRPGVHIIGELGGMGLIKNAMTQGLQLAKHLGDTMVRAKPSHVVDVAIVGAGPAGIALALGLKQCGLSFRLLDQEAFGGSLAHFPRQKVTMLDSVNLPFFGTFGDRQITKNELLDSFKKMILKTGATVEAGFKVVGIQGSDGQFVVKTTKGDVPAKKVALATGRRGTPKKLGVPGEDLKKVAYRLIDPEQYQDKKVLIVGGGDSAFEAVIQLAEQSNAEIILSYRNAVFNRGRPEHRERLKHYIETQRVKVAMNSVLSNITEHDVELSSASKQRVIKNDYVIPCIGGEVPIEFLKSIGINIERHFGTVPQQKRRAPVASAGGSRIAKAEIAEERKRRQTTYRYFIAGVLILLALTAFGWSYYILSPERRARSPLHPMFRSSGSWGHGIGIAATLVMLSNFFYSARKRWRILKGRSTIRSWLSFHMFVGFMTPLVILFHAAFQSKNLFATMTFVGLLVVVTTGFFGRFIYSFIPISGDHKLQLSEILSRFEQHKSALRPILESARSVDPARLFVRWITTASTDRSPIQMLASWPLDYFRIRAGLFRARPLFSKRSEYLDFRDSIFTLLRLKRQMSGYAFIRKLISVWRGLHVVLAVSLVILIIVHIYITTSFGYRWLF